MCSCKAIAESRSSSACGKTRRRLPPSSHSRLGTKCSGGAGRGRGKWFLYVHHASVISYKLVGYTEAAERVGRVKAKNEPNSYKSGKENPVKPNKAAAGEPAGPADWWPVVVVGRSVGPWVGGSAGVASVGEAGRVHVVVRSVREASRPGEKRQALGLLQHHLQLLEVLQPRHILVLAARERRHV